jgi:hypothetical protein
MNHVMSPTGVAVLLMLALVVDYMSFGPNSVRDRIAFLIAIVSFRQGFNGSQLDQWTVGAATELINSLKGMTGGAYIAGAATQVVLSAAVGILAIYTVGCLLPVKANKKLGSFAELAFRQSGAKRINTQLWVMAAILGMTAELPGGIVGSLLTASIDALTKVVSPLPNWLFGA